jgi:hypothetical protein
MQIVCLRIIKGVVQAPAFFSSERAIDYQAGNSTKVPEFEKFCGQFEIPIEFLYFPVKISKPGTGSLKPFIGANDPDIVPHESPDLVPIVIDDNDFIDILGMSGAPFREPNFLMVFRIFGPYQCIGRSSSHHERLEQRIAGESIRSMEACRADLAHRE